MIVSLLWFALGLAALVRGGDWFVDGAVAMATRFRLPETLIGATVVSIGTTLPEVMVSVTSAASGHGELAYGNAVGSVLCNAALIAGLSITARPGESQRREAALPTVFFFLAAGLYCAAAYGMGGFGRGTGLALLALFALYLAVTLRRFRGQGGEREEPVLGGSFRREIALLLLGAAANALGAELLVKHGTLLARALGVPEAARPGLLETLRALGTSLPELATAVTALCKGHGALSLGNILGANLFNLVLVSGAAAAISPFPLPESRTLAGLNGTLVLDLPLMLLAMALLTVPVLLRGRTYRWQGAALLALYAFFCGMQFV